MRGLVQRNQIRASRGQRCVGGELKADEKTVDVAHRIDAGDGFLPEITTLYEADGLGVATDLLGEVVGGDVEAKEGEAGFEAGGFDDWVVARN